VDFTFAKKTEKFHPLFVVLKNSKNLLVLFKLYPFFSKTGRENISLPEKIINIDF
jgi:hypothetical protein